jgi:hypothetical protein
MTNTYHTLYHPSRTAGSTGSAFAVHFTPKGDEVEIVNHIQGGIGCTMTVPIARLYYKGLLEQGYTKPQDEKRPSKKSGVSGMQVQFLVNILIKMEI